MERELLDSEERARVWIGETFAPSSRQWEYLERFAELLIAENDRQNLIAASTIPNLWVRHIADSAQLLALALMLVFAGYTVAGWVSPNAGLWYPFR